MYTLITSGFNVLDGTVYIYSGFVSHWAPAKFTNMATFSHTHLPLLKLQLMRNQLGLNCWS